VAEIPTVGRGTERDGADPLLEAGTRVEVRRRFDGSWTRGFEIAGTDEEGLYLLRRLSDGTVLPVPFDPEDVRRDRRRRQGFWWQ